MFRKLLLLFVIFSFVFNYCMPSYAKKSSSVTCRFNGGEEDYNQRIKTKDITIFLDQDFGDLEFDIAYEQISGDQEYFISIFAPFDSIDSIERGAVYNTTSDEFELEIDKIDGDNETNIFNSFEDENGDPVEATGTVKFKKVKNNVATGELTINFPRTELENNSVFRKTTRKQMSEDFDEELFDEEFGDDFDDDFSDDFDDDFSDDVNDDFFSDVAPDNGAISVTCKFKSIAIEE